MLILKRDHFIGEKNLQQELHMAFTVTVMKEKIQAGIQKKNSTPSIKNSIDMNHFKITAIGETKIE